MSGNGYRGNGGPRQAAFFDLCEPFLINAAVFIGLVGFDILNQQKDLIPFHAVAGIVISLVTLALCRYDFSTLAWVLTIFPAIFVGITVVYALTQHKYFISATQAVGSAYNEAAGWSTQAVTLVKSINDSGRKTYSESETAWINTYSRLVGNGMDPAKAAVAASATNGDPKPGSDADNLAKNSGANNKPVSVKGEYLYLCGDGVDPRSAPTGVFPEICIKLVSQCNSRTDYECLDEKLSLLIPAPAPAACLGMLPSGGAAPSYSARNNCIACETSVVRDNYDTEAKYKIDLAKCRCEAMGNCPTNNFEATGTTGATGATGTPTLGSQGFANYGSW